MSSTPELLFDGHWLKLLKRGKHVYASRRPAGDPIRSDAVMLIAWHLTPNRPGARLAVLREFRVPTNQYQLALPAGLIDAGETPEATAVRELREETGLVASRVIGCSRMPLFASAGMSDETTTFVTLECHGRLASNPGVGGEQIQPMLIGRSEARQMLADAETQGLAMCARLWPILTSIALTGGFAGVTAAD